VPVLLSLSTAFHLLFGDPGWSTIAVGQWIPVMLSASMEFHLLFADCGWSAIAVGHWIPVMLSASMEFHLLFGDCGWSAITVGHRITVMLSASMSFHLLLSMAPLRSTLIVFGEQFCGEATYPSIINRYCQMRYYSARFVCALFMTAKLNNGPLAGRCKPLTKTHIRHSSTSNLSA
jgi:hypothetical protein